MTAPRFVGKIALITGAAGGIGRAAAVPARRARPAEKPGVGLLGS